MKILVGLGVALAIIIGLALGLEPAPQDEVTLCCTRYIHRQRIAEPGEYALPETIIVLAGTRGLVNGWKTTGYDTVFDVTWSQGYRNAGTVRSNVRQVDTPTWDLSR